VSIAGLLNGYTRIETKLEINATLICFFKLFEN